MTLDPSARLGAFVATTDPAAARAFYGDLLGLALVDENPFALVFDVNGTHLRVTRVDEAVVQPYTVLGWEVDDIRAEVTALVERGIAFLDVDGIDQDDLGIWLTPDGTKVAWFHDPEGHTLSLAQHT